VELRHLGPDRVIVTGLLDLGRDAQLSHRLRQSDVDLGTLGDKVEDHPPGLLPAVGDQRVKAVLFESLGDQLEALEGGRPGELGVRLEPRKFRYYSHALDQSPCSCNYSRGPCPPRRPLRTGLLRDAGELRGAHVSLTARD